MATYVAVFALILAYVALVAAYIALRTLAKLRRSTTLLARTSRGEAGYESLLELTGRYAERTEIVAEQSTAVAEQNAGLAAQLATLRALVEEDHAEPVEQLNGALRNTALVRYDAFTDLSGRMSFSLALLDEDGSGVTLSAIAGRSDTRVYAKGVTAGKGEHELSPEEQQAVDAARHTKRGLLHRKSA